MTKDQRESIEALLNHYRKMSDMYEAKSDKAYEDHEEEKRLKYETKMEFYEGKIDGIRECLQRLGHDAINPYDGCYSRDYLRFIVVER